MKTVKVVLGRRSYNILIGRGLIKKAGSLIRPLGLGEDAVVITNKTLGSLYGAVLERSLANSGISARFLYVPDSEKAKSAAVATRLIDRISGFDKRRDLFIIALGGGVVGDLAGFVASVYKRGVPYVQIPTTLLAQVDSAIGGKVAIDLPVAKNLVGAFYQPRLVISDTDLLKTLRPRQLKSGLAEVIKYGVIKDRRLFEFLESEYRNILGLRPSALEFIVERSSRIKAGVVSRDEFDNKGVRVTLNLGHTIGHAIEAACGYSSSYNHGEAVAAGMVAATALALSLGVLKKSDADRMLLLIMAVGLPTSIRGLSTGRIYEACLHDKKVLKRQNRFVLPAGIGKIKVVSGVPDRLVRAAIKELLCRTA